MSAAENTPDPSESKISLKPICELLTQDGTPINYRIRAYQRGYRWSTLQVTQLLDDIWDFIQNGTGQFYCLQPLVVKIDDGVIEVVDGQQRLITLHIILSCLKPVAPGLIPNLFDLTFETRDDASRPSLDPIDLDREMENIDYYHICKAYRAVQKWCDDHSASQRLKLLQHILNDDESGRNVKVIWFELGKHDHPVDAFTRLNVGKIRLTDDELIRALFLGRGQGDPNTEDESLKVQIAYEWDLIEKELQTPDFWAFLTDERREQNRIHFLFNLIATADGIPADLEHDEYKVFYAFSEKLANSTPRREWLRIKQEYMRLQEWFEDDRRITYHIIGFLVTQSVSLVEIRALSENCTKSDFDHRLRNRVYQAIIGAPAVPPEPELRAALSAHIEGLNVGTARGKEKIRAILLLFNIATLLENRKSNMRFHFGAFKSDKWDIEHIRSIASHQIRDREGWLRDSLSIFLPQDGDKQAAQLCSDIQNYLSASRGALTEDSFERLRISILEHFGESEADDEWDDLANLTLLDRRTNRSYKNDPFALKRHTILSLDKAGIFIPLCTRNVFLKAYSPQVGNPIFWTEQDGEAYQNAIFETLVGFFLGKEISL